MPPNTTQNYDYTNPAQVESDIEDWTPDNIGSKTIVSADTWENLSYSWPDNDIPQKTESQFYIYWMQNMPGYNNQIPYEQYHMTNWWRFTADWDAAIRAQQANLKGDQKFMLASAGINPFEMMQFLRGTENLLIDLAYGTEEFRQLREMVHQFNLKLLDGWTKTEIDGLIFSDDWGSQTSLLISPTMWREVFKPLYMDYYEMVHARGKKVFFHSDGYIIDIYEDLIEVGVDALNSQLFCMDIEELARRFKGRITFWGEIDRQWTLPFGTVEDVRRAVGRVRRALDDGNGGVIAQCEWGVNNPPENIREVFAAWDAPLEDLPQ